MDQFIPVTAGLDIRWTEAPWSTLRTHLASPLSRHWNGDISSWLQNARGPCSTYAMRQHRSSAHLWQKHCLQE